MKRFIYVSECMVREFDVQDIGIMRQALANNGRDGISGFLHRTRTHYFQCVEGPNEAVDRLVVKIAIDHRHCRFLPLLSSEVPFPLFSGWSMGYSRNISAESQVFRPNMSAELILEMLVREADKQVDALLRKSREAPPPSIEEQPFDCLARTWATVI